MKTIEKIEAKEKAKELLKFLFEKGKKITDNELRKIIVIIKNDNTLNKIFKDFKKYNFFVDIDDQEKIIKKNFFRNLKFSDLSMLNINHEEIISKYSPLEMFLIAVLWKQGDYGKEQQILKGINNPNISANKVFPQFGHFLITLSEENQKDKPNYENIEPIIDQHSLRAFCFSKGIEYKEGRDSSQNTYKEYIKWHRGILKKCTNAEHCFLMLNEIMFVLGKALK